MSEIKLSEVKKAYKAIDYNICSAVYLDSSTKSCCPISAIMMHEGTGESTSAIIASAKSKFGEEFMLGFTAGFDNCVYNEAYDKDAFDNGVKIRKGLHVK